MPNGMQGLDLNMPDAMSGKSVTEQLEDIYNYLYQMMDNLKYLLRNLGVNNFNDKELDNLTAPIYKSIGDVSGALLEVKATAEGAQVTASNAEGAATKAQITADGASVTASNAYGKAQSIELTVDGFTVKNGQGQTLIDGGKITADIVNVNDYINLGSRYSNGEKLIYFNNSAFIKGDSNGYGGAPLITISAGGIQLPNILTNWIESYGVLKLIAGGNMSIDAGGTVYVGTSNGGCQVDIGGPYSTVNINGNVNINGAPYVPGGVSSGGGSSGGSTGGDGDVIVTLPPGEETTPFVP